MRNTPNIRQNSLDVVTHPIHNIMKHHILLTPDEADMCVERYSRHHLELVRGLWIMNLAFIAVGISLSVFCENMLPISLSSGLAMGIHRLSKRISTGSSMLIE